MLVKELADFKDLKLQIITLQYPFAKGSYDFHGVKVYALGGQNKKGLPRFSTWFKAYKLLKALNKEKKIDTVLSCWVTESAVIGSRFAKFNNSKHICWIIGQDSRPENKYIPYILNNTIFVCKTPFIKDYFRKNHGKEPTHIIPSGINLNSLPVPNFSNRSIDLIGVGSLILLKRFDWFVNLANDLQHKGRSVNCILIGDGPERSALQNRIKEFGLSETFKLLGNKDHKEVVESMTVSKILIHPSSFEGLSTVTLEALYAGCHVITYCRPFEEENEQMHYINSYPELLQKTEELLSRNDLHHSSQSNYTSKKTAESFYRLF